MKPVFARKNNEVQVEWDLKGRKWADTDIAGLADHGQESDILNTVRGHGRPYVRNKRFDLCFISNNLLQLWRRWYWTEEDKLIYFYIIYYYGDCLGKSKNWLWLEPGKGICFGKSQMKMWLCHQKKSKARLRLTDMQFRVISGSPNFGMHVTWS